MKISNEVKVDSYNGKELDPKWTHEDLAVVKRDSGINGMIQWERILEK